MPGVPWHNQILADQLTLFQPGGTDYAHLITTGTRGFSDLPTALILDNTLAFSFRKKQGCINGEIFGAVVFKVIVAAPFRAVGGASSN